MALGVVGRKCGMTRIFKDDGTGVPVTVIEVGTNRVTQVKTVDTDGYSAIQVTSGSQSSSRINKPMSGHLAKAGVEPGTGLVEFRIDQDKNDFAVGSEITVDMFSEGEKVDVSGTSIGKGYAGTVKRHNFATKDASHGNSLSHRTPGSIGQNQTPGRVFKGKKNVWSDGKCALHGAEP